MEKGNGNDQLFPFSAKKVTSAFRIPRAFGGGLICGGAIMLFNTAVHVTTTAMYTSAGVLVAAGIFFILLAKKLI